MSTMDLSNQYETLKLSQLAIAQSSNVLLFTRDKYFLQLARKLRPEFGHLFISNELKDCQRIIGAVTNKTIAEEKPDDTNYGVSILLADIDTIAVKLAEFVNKRSRDENTNHCPVIPTIFFTHDGVDETDLLDSLMAVGGATKILKASCPTKDVLYTIIEVLYKCKLVENTYKELNARKTLVSKYPYYPLFQSTNDKSTASHSHKQPRKDKESRDKDTDEVSTGDSSELSLRERLEDRDDWTRSSSLLPKFVKDLRKNAPEKVKVQKSNAADRERVNTSGKSQGEEKEKEKTTIPAIEMRSNASLSTTSQSSSSVIDSERVVVDPLNFHHLDNDAIDDLVETSLGGQDSSHLEKSLQLLHPSTRPTCSMLQPRRSANMLSSNTDIYPFFNKPMPELSAQLTVGGLDKRFVTPCWDILHSQLFLKEKEKEKDNAKSVNKGSPVKSSFDNKISHHETVTLTPSKNDHNNSLNMSRGKSGSRKVSFSDSHGRSDHVDDSDLGSKSTLNTMESSKLMDKARRQLSGLTTLPVNKGTNLGVLLDIQAAKAEKKIMALTNEVAPDILFTKLVEIDFNNRKINTGELDILQKGLKLEEKGDVNAAITSYTRAGANSKDAQLSKMLLGSLNFRIGKFMTALSFYTKAIKELKDKPTQIKLDEFVAYHNRGVINFRLGDDEFGLSDIEKAAEIQPDNVECRTLLSLAYRRMGKFKQAIDQCVEVKQIRINRQDSSPTKPNNTMLDSGSINTASQGNGDSVSAVNESLHEVNDDSGGKDRLLSTTMTAAMIATQLENDRRALAIEVAIPEPTLRNSFHHRKLEAILSSRQNKQDIGGDATDSDAKGGGQLKAFKLRNGMRMELFHDLFIHPSELQKSLLVEPSQRSADDRQVICTALRLFPFLRDLTDSSINNLANVVEYRAVVSTDKLFEQNGLSHAVCLLLGGAVEVRVELQDNSMSLMQEDSDDKGKEKEKDKGSEEEKKKKNQDIVGDAMGLNLVVGEINPNDTFGHIDFLFRHNNPVVVKELEDALNAFGDKGDSQDSTAPSSQHGKYSSINALGATAGSATYSKRKADRGSIVINTPHIEVAPMPVIKIMEDNPHRQYQQSNDVNDGDQKPAEPGVLARALEPGMFMSYHMRSMCEMLLIGQQDFERLLLKTAIAELKNRISVIRSSGIFNDWSYPDQIRLARMGQVKTYRRGDIILNQGSAPQYLYIILKGLCKVLKRPNRTEMLLQRLVEAEEQIERHKLKYVYDHTLRNVLSRVAVEPDVQSDFNSQLSSSEAEAWSHITQPEFIRYQLGVEVQKLENLKQRALKEDEREKAMEEKKVLYSMLQSAALESDPKVKEIATLQWPMIFGEACVLDPTLGVSKGSITADTACDILMLHKVQLQTFLVDEKFLNRVKVKAVRYPADPDIVVSLYRDQEWQHYKKAVIKEIPKDKWPLEAKACEAPEFRV